MSMDGQPGISRSRFSPGEPTSQGLQVAGHVVAQRGVDRLQVELQLARGVHPPEVGAGLAGVLGDQPGVVVVEQVGILVRQAEGGGRLGGHDVVALADRFGQDGDVVPGQPPGVVERPAGDRPPCRPASARGGT